MAGRRRRLRRLRRRRRQTKEAPGEKEERQLCDVKLPQLRRLRRKVEVFAGEAMSRASEGYPSESAQIGLKSREKEGYRSGEILFELKGEPPKEVLRGSLTAKICSGSEDFSTRDEEIKASVFA